MSRKSTEWSVNLLLAGLRTFETIATWLRYNFSRQLKRARTHKSKRVLRSEALNRARILVRCLEKGHTQYRWALRELQRCLREHELTLSDVGVTGADLHEFCLKGSRAMTLHALKHLMRGSDQFPQFFKILRAELRRSGLSLASIGLTPRVVAILQLQSLQTAVRNLALHTQYSQRRHDEFKARLAVRLYVQQIMAVYYPQPVTTAAE